MGWTAEQEEELRRLWTEGLPTGDIGKALNVTKNAVVGKAHRLGLESRPSPIKRAGSKEKAVKQTAPAPSKRAEPREAVVVKEAKKEKKKEKELVEEKVEVVEKKADKKAVKGKIFKVSDLTSRTCRWPIGDPKDEDFHFCGKPVMDDKPYCEEHVAEAYVSAKSLR